MKTGVIGLGAMGAPMAFNLHKAGHLFAVWNRTREKAERVAMDTGALLAETPAELAERCELIITSVSRDADVKSVIEALLPTIPPSTVVADTSTVSAETAKEVAKRLHERGAAFLDCPVSGGVEGAKKGTLAMMIGGDANALDRIRETLAAVATTIIHIGPQGSGQAAKAVNQIMAAGINQAVTEALAFGQAMGLSMDRVIDIVASGAAGNWFLSHRGKSMLAGEFQPGFKVSLHHKDLEICRDMAKNVGAGPLAIVEMTLHHYQQLMKSGHGEEDISTLFRLKAKQQSDASGPKKERPL